jgi:hypothetical protein
MITIMISTRLHEFDSGVLQPSPLKEISSRDYKHRRGYKRGTHASLRREKLWILGTEEILGLPHSLLLRMMALVNLVEANRSSPLDLVQPTEKLHWML